ncbi:hypothetical protein Bca4012_049784 [Brassica carinata]
MITCWVRFKISGDTFLSSFVYAFNGAGERRALWQEMEMISNSVASSMNPWIIQGDFNVAVSMEEHSSAATNGGDRNSIREFQEAVRACDLVDLSHSVPGFTWSNSQDDNPISKKLDRFLVNASWLSGSFSLTLFLKLAILDFLRLCLHLWNETEPIYHSHSALTLFHQKLNMLKPDLRALNRDIYGDLPARVAEAYTYLCAKQTEAMNNPQTSTFEATLASHFGIEEQFFYQRSWIQWLDLGYKEEAASHFEAFLQGVPADFEAFLRNGSGN